MIREPVVAGQFYPGSRGALEEYLQMAALVGRQRIKVTGVMSPHASYTYSGGVAAKVFAEILVPDTVVLLGPNHTGCGIPAAVWSKGGWKTPLGTVPVEEKLAAALIDGCPDLMADREAHLGEHSLEVQLPFLQHANSAVSIVPVTFMGLGWPEVERVGADVAKVLKSWRKPVLIVASTDMTHYEPRDRAQEKDTAALEKAVDLDARGLMEVVRSRQVSMCGVIPSAIMLTAARALGATEAQQLAYATSGDVSGDNTSVVGYAGVVVPAPA